MFSVKYQERIDRITQASWKSFVPPTELYNEHDFKRFLQEAKKIADDEFWTGEWRDLPADDDGLVYYLHQFWLHRFKRIMNKIERDKE